jgi:hypothetical protein
VAVAVTIDAGGCVERGAFDGVAGSNRTGDLKSGVRVLVRVVGDMSVAAGLRVIRSAGEERQGDGVPVAGDGTQSLS